MRESLEEVTGALFTKPVALSELQQELELPFLPLWGWFGSIVVAGNWSGRVMVE